MVIFPSFGTGSQSESKSTAINPSPPVSQVKDLDLKQNFKIKENYVEIKKCMFDA
jgi:hypothetical protein